MPSEFLVATFVEADHLRSAVRALRAHGFRIYDVFAPYPLHGLDEDMSLRRSRLPIVALIAGLLGLGLAVGFQFYAAVFDWPLNVGGKPANSTLAFVPITFELTVLSAGVGIALAFLVRCRLFPGASEVRFIEGATEDVFGIVLRRRHATFDAGAATR
jgi:hypothetical protein